jgi:hypothetical protein
MFHLLPNGNAENDAVNGDASRTQAMCRLQFILGTPVSMLTKSGEPPISTRDPDYFEM